MLTLRELKYLVRDALFEGVEQDRQELVKLYPEQEGDISRLGPKWIMWLMARFGPSAKLEETHPFADAIATVKNYSQRDAAISQKYNSSEQWRQAVDAEFPNRKWKNPADVMTMSADDMETLLAMSQRKKQNVDVSQVSNVEQDRIGKVGPWNLWMPTTRENSCQIAGYDPATMKPYTTWCTARTADSNLFYNYVGREGVILFYLIKDDAKSSSDRLSIGFANGKPVLNGERGGISVDANNGLNEKSLKSLLGGHYDQIMATLQDVANKYQGNHPAQKKIAEGAQSLVALKSMLKGLSQDEQNDLMIMIAEQKTLSNEVAEYLCQVDNESIRGYIASNPNMSVEILSQLAQDKVAFVRRRVALNPSAPIEILTQLVNDNNLDVRHSVASNPNTTHEILRNLMKNGNTVTKRFVACNPNLPNDIIVQLITEKDPAALEWLAGNKNLSGEMLTLLASKTRNTNVLWQVAQNPNTSTEVLTKLSQSKYTLVKNTALEQLQKRQQNENKVYERVLRRLRSLL